MLDRFDNILRTLFMSEVKALGSSVSGEQVAVQPPDEDWRNSVSLKSLNIYLIELRENRKLRSNERVRTYENGSVIDTPAPARLDCHYLITAWSPAQESLGKTIEENQLLYEVTEVLMRHQPLIPREVFEPAAPVPAELADIADLQLPTVVAPVEGFAKYAEFWGTMGEKQPWKPAVYLIVTLPVLLPTMDAGPMVTTRITEYRRTDQPETAEVWVQIGGVVTAPNSSPVAGAWVGLEDAGGRLLQHMETNEAGRFIFANLAIGSYVLRARVAGLNEGLRSIGVPSTDGRYDVQLNP